MQFRDLHAQYATIKEDIDESIANVLADCAFIGGSQVKQLESELADYVGVKHCITCANGTDALQLALMAWGVGPGDAVFVPDFTFFSSGEVVAAVGATPIFVDVDRRSFNISPIRLEEAICAAEADGEIVPRVVIAVDLFGLPANYQAIREICSAHQLLLLEDGAQGFGGSINGVMACSFGDISTTSFFPAKPLGCYGDGGAVFTNDGKWANLIRSYAVHGKGSMKYDNVRIGMNSRLDTLQAAILLPKLHAFIEHEIGDANRVASWYQEALQPMVDYGFALPMVPDGYSSSWAQYTIQVPKEIERDSLQEALKNQGVPSMVYYPKPMHLQQAFAGMLSEHADCPITQELCNTVLSLPMGPYLEKDSIKEIGKVISSLM